MSNKFKRETYHTLCNEITHTEFLNSLTSEKHSKQLIYLCVLSSFGQASSAMMSSVDICASFYTSEAIIAET
jgi:hypothetical protein